MKVPSLHRWDLPPKEAMEVQQSLLAKLVQHNELSQVRTVAGVDMGIAGDQAHAAIVVLSFPDLKPVEAAQAEAPLDFPYIPGLLAFREGPAILAAAERLQIEPDLFIFDGQGLAHPRRMGIASHIGVILDKPSIGCAKSRLCGEHGQVGPNVGDYAELHHQGQVIGAVLRTREGVKPVFISIGHKVALPTAIDYVLRCGAGYRLPEPTRWAHRVASGGELPGIQAQQGTLF